MSSDLSKAPAQSMGAVDVSVVIGTFNRAAVLRRAIDSLANQETGGKFTYEIIIVDNASTDDTPNVIASSASGNAVAIRGFMEPRHGVAAARNRSILEATGEWVAFHDDDQSAEPSWLSELLAMAERKNCLVVGGDVLLELPPMNRRRLSPVCRRLLGEMTGFDGERRFNRRLVPGTNNLLIHRSVLERVGLFDEHCDSGEDADLYRRIRMANYECWFTPAAVVHHIIPPERLKTEYMRWTAMRHGGHVALRELREWGWLALPLVLAARIGQASLVYFPKYLFACLRGDDEAALGARCLLWRSEAYIRHALSLLVPAVFRQSALEEAMNFRHGRQKLVEGQPFFGRLRAD
jgi:glycosyltransferase involved in cell wall biosynthesis